MEFIMQDLVKAINIASEGFKYSRLSDLDLVNILTNEGYPRKYAEDIIFYSSFENVQDIICNLWHPKKGEN